MNEGVKVRMVFDGFDSIPLGVFSHGIRKGSY